MTNRGAGERLAPHTSANKAAELLEHLPLDTAGVARGYPSSRPAEALRKPNEGFDWSRMSLDGEPARSESQDARQITMKELYDPDSSPRLSAEMLRRVEAQEGMRSQLASLDISRGPPEAGAPAGERKTASCGSGQGKEASVESRSSAASRQVLEVAGPVRLDERGMPIWQDDAELAAAEEQAAADKARKQMAANFVAHTVQALPCRAEAVSCLRGPVLLMNPVDQTSIDVRVFHSFRAHFSPEELQQALQHDHSWLSGLSGPEELTSLMEELASGGSHTTETGRTDSDPSQAGAPSVADSKAPSGMLQDDSCRLEGRLPSDPSQVASVSRSPSAHARQHRSAPGNPAMWLQRTSSQIQNEAWSSHSKRNTNRNSPADSALLGPMKKVTAELASGKRPQPSEMTEVSPFHQHPPIRSPRISLTRLSSMGRHSRTPSEFSKGSGPASLEFLASDSTGGLSSSQDGMRSPIVQDGVVDAVEQARSKLANVEHQQSTHHSLANYDQEHQRAVILTAAHKEQLGSWEIDPNAVIIGDRIAMGGFAEVFIGKYEGTVVAVKLLLMFDEITTDRVLKEVRVLAQLRHPNLILFMGFCLQPRPAIVCEFMQRGSLFKVLQKQGGPLEGKLARAIAIAVTRGMAYLHGRSPVILHLDLKSPNILLDDRWHCKIADFGLSKTRERTLMSRGAAGGTPEWMAPEMLRCEPFDERADVYSFGVCLWETLTGKVPWEGLHAMQVVGAVGFQRKTLPRPEHTESFLTDLCMQCMDQDPANRSYFPAIVRSLEQEFASPKLVRLNISLSEAAANGRLISEGTPPRASGGPVAQRLPQRSGSRRAVDMAS